MKRPLSDDAKSGNFAPRFLESCRATSDTTIREADFNRAMEGLFRSRAIENLEYGKPSDLRQKIGRSA